MAFNSGTFLIFLPLVVLIYWLIPHKFRWIFLLAASLYAYMSWNAWVIFPIAGTVIVSYCMSAVTARTKSTKVKKLCLAATIIVCLGLLIFFKYCNFLVQSATDFINLFIPAEARLTGFAWDIILPVGISFYTFQTLSYVIDVYKGKIEPERHFGYYALYLIFFPQLVAGPIERPEKLLPQLKEKQSANRSDFAAGFRWILSGFVKKCVIADFAAKFVNTVFANYMQANGFAISVAAVLFAIQIYCDFAGYSEIAIGAARLMGIRLTSNFNRPFLSLSIGEYIRRWHITLNTWFRDYVYIPLGGSRKGGARTCLNVMIVFALCGLWHGANWTFVCWGLYIGALLCIERIMKAPLAKLFSKAKININSQGVILLRRILFFVLIVPSSLLFRSASIADFVLMFARIFTEAGFSVQYFTAAFASLSMKPFDFLQLLTSVVVLYQLYCLTQYDNERPALPLRGKPSLDGVAAMRYSSYIYLVLAVALGWLILIAGNGLSSFVYFQF